MTTKVGPYPRLSSSQYCSGSHTAPRAMMIVVRLVYSARLSPFAASSSRESPALWWVHHQTTHFALQCCDLRSRDQSGVIQRYSQPKRPLALVTMDKLVDVTYLPIS